MIHHLFFVQCAQCSWTCSVLVCKCASGRLCHLEKIAFWAIIEGPFAGDAFRGVNGCCMGFDFWERQLPIGGWLILRHPNRDSCPEPLFFDLTNQVFLLRSKAPSHLFLPVCVSACLFVYLLPIHLSMRQPLSVCNNAG